MRIPPGPGVRTIAKVPLRRGEVDTEFDQEMLAELLDQLPFNFAIADLYKTRFNGVPGVVYAAGVRHAYNVAAAFRDVGLKAQAVSGETPKRELAQILARYERGDVDVLVNAQLLAEGWNSPRATVCMHLAPTASKRIYQQRVGRVTRRQPGKEAGIVVDFVHPATKHDDPVVTLHSLLDRDVYRGGAIVVGPVRRGRGRRLRVERRVLPVTADENRRIEVFERELWRIAVEHLDYGEQVQWAALAGARVAPAGWRRARAMLHFDQGGELKRAFLLTAIERNKNPQLRLRALQEVAASRDAEAFDRALDFVEGWPREEKREGVKTVLLALAEKKIGRRDQANNWIWRCANMTREVHEEYAVQRWPETKRLLGLLVNSSGSAHARNARRLVHAARQQDRRLERRAARRRHPAHRRGRRGDQRRADADVAQAGRAGPRAAAQLPEGQEPPHHAPPAQEGRASRAWRPRPWCSTRSRWRRWTTGLEEGELEEVPVEVLAEEAAPDEVAEPIAEEAPEPRRRTRRRVVMDEEPAPEEVAEEAPEPRRTRRAAAKPVEAPDVVEAAPKPRRTRRAPAGRPTCPRPPRRWRGRPRRSRRRRSPAARAARWPSPRAWSRRPRPSPRRRPERRRRRRRPRWRRRSRGASVVRRRGSRRSSRRRRSRAGRVGGGEAGGGPEAVEPVAEVEAPKPRRTRRAAAKPAEAPEAVEPVAEVEAPKPRRTRRAAATRSRRPRPSSRCGGRRRSRAGRVVWRRSRRRLPRPSRRRPSRAGRAAAARPRRPSRRRRRSRRQAAPDALRRRSRGGSESPMRRRPRRTRRAAAKPADAPEAVDEAPKPRRTRRAAKKPTEPLPTGEAA